MGIYGLLLGRNPLKYLGKPQKSPPPLKGGGVKGRTTNKKELF